MEDLFYNPELEELMPEEQDEDVWSLPEKEYDYDNIEEDLSYLDEDVEDIDDDEEDDFEFFFGNDHKKYIDRKIYKEIPIPKGGKVVDTGREAYKRLLAKGYNSKVLAAIIGNGVVESNLNPGAIGDHGTAFGINQNRFEKADYFNKEYSRADSSLQGLDKHIAAQYNSVKNNYPGIYKKVSSARNFNDAAMIYGKEYEKPKYLTGDRGTYADLITKQTGGYNDISVMQTAGLRNPFAFNKGAIGYSPAPTTLQATVPSDFGKFWDQSKVQYSPNNTQNTTLDITKKLDPTGISQVVGQVDEIGSQVFDTLNTAYDFTKQIKNTGALLADGAVTGATSILSSLENDRLFRKKLKDMYRESEQEYYG